MAENFSCPSVTGNEALTVVSVIVKAKLIPAFSSIKANSQSISSGSSTKLIQWLNTVFDFYPSACWQNQEPRQMYRPTNITQYLGFLLLIRLCQFQRKPMSLLFSREPWENTEKAYFQVDPWAGWVTLHWLPVINMRRVRFNSYSNTLAEGWTGIDSLHLLWLSLGRWEPNTSLPHFTISSLPKV